MYRVAIAFNPSHPIGWLSQFAGVSYSTAKTWAYGHKHWAYGNRRPPLQVLKDIYDAIEQASPSPPGTARMLALRELLRGYIWEREREPVKPRAGFNVIRERDGPGSVPRDGRNRRGRPRRVVLAR
jgi:hypothetical protein